MLSISNYIEPQPIDDNTDGEETGAIYVWNRNGFELFGGSEDSGVYYADNVNKLAAKIPTVNVYSMGHRRRMLTVVIYALAFPHFT